MPTRTAKTRKHARIVSNPKADPESSPEACEIVVWLVEELYRQRERAIRDEPAPVPPLALCRRA